MRLLRTLTLLAAALAITSAPALSGGPKQPSTVELTILHTNDTHGHLLPFSYPETFDPGSILSRLQARRDIGGIARRAAIAKKLKTEKGRVTLLVDAGDICDGTPFSTEYRGLADTAAMNAAGYDLGCPGNHEMNNKPEQVTKLVAAAKFPLVCANLRRKDGTPSPYRPYVIRRAGPVRVAFLGLITVEAASYPAAREAMIIDDPVATARALVPKLRMEADIVVALTHLGADVDRVLATSVPGINAIIGGHSHTYLPRPLFIGDVPGDARSVNGTIIAQNFEWGAHLGRLDLTLSRSSGGRWVVSRYAGRLIPVLATCGSDARTAAAVTQYWHPIRARYAARIGTAIADFTKKGPDRAEYNLVADAIRAATGAQVVLDNIGGVRAPLVRGPITYADLVTMDPFGNTLVRMRLSGSEIRAVLEQRRPSVSGLRYRYAQGRVSAVIVGSEPLADDREYTVAVNSFFAKDALFANGRDRQDNATPRLEAVIRYVKQRGSVRPAYDGRRVVLGIPDD